MNLPKKIFLNQKEIYFKGNSDFLSCLCLEFAPSIEDLLNLLILILALIPHKLLEI